MAMATKYTRKLSLVFDVVVSHYEYLLSLASPSTQRPSSRATPDHFLASSCHPLTPIQLDHGPWFIDDASGRRIRFEEVC